MVHDQARGVTFWEALYLNAAQTKGVVRIFVRPSIPGGNACYYDIRTGAAGSNTVPDFPHLAITNDYLYLTTNNILNAATWTGSSVIRFNIDQMSECLVTSFSTYNWTGGVGQRIFRPARGGREAMYWGSIETASKLRVFRWLDSVASPTNAVVNINSSSFGNPDCRGGNNNVDFIERSTGYSSQGFTMSSAVGRSGGKNYVGFYWNVGPDGTAGHNQGHIHSAVIEEGTNAVLAQPHIYNSTFCVGYPAVASNARGDIGFALVYGGRSGGGGGAATAAQGAVGIDDEFTAGMGYVATLFSTGAATNNPSRVDYLSVHQHHPCDLAFDAATHSTSGATVNRYYTEFLRERDGKCYYGRRNSLP